VSAGEFEQNRGDSSHTRPDDALAGAAANVMRVRDHLRDAVVGRDDVVELVLAALLAGGHVLLEDFPGSGKTVLARALGGAISDADPTHRIASFRRIQFTPDLLPSDITGTTVFDPDRSTFEFRPGPIFAHVLLADEINRTSPKVQSALLEAMAERQVTVDNFTHPLDELFLVVATQNPQGLAGTFPLPAPQLDRFLFKIRMTHIDRDAELEVLASFRQRLERRDPGLPKVTRDELIESRRAILDHVALATEIQAGLVDVARAVRADPRVSQGISTRALVQASPALQARAMLRGRDYVSTDDVDSLLEPLFAHRLALAPGVTGAAAVLREAAVAPLESLSRNTLRGD